jgi:hypothetical protein
MKKILISLFSCLALTSCQKEIVLDLDSSNTKIVIEGVITDQNENYKVRITKTVNFTESNNFPAVTGAIVTISDDAGNSEKLTETSAGTYQTAKLKGTPGRTYSLNVNAEGVVYTAKSKMPSPVILNDLRIVKNLVRPPGETEDLYNTFPQFIDPQERGNNYQFIQSTDRLGRDNAIVVSNDNVENGQPYSRPVVSRDFKVKAGDILTLEMRCIDKPTYDYFFTLAQIKGNGPGGGTTPTNPDSNISGGALGYFSAYTVQRKSITVK